MTVIDIKNEDELEEFDLAAKISEFLCGHATKGYAIYSNGKLLTAEAYKEELFEEWPEDKKECRKD